METDLKLLAKDFVREGQYEAALQVLTKVYAEHDFEAMALMGDIYQDKRFEGRNTYRAMSCYLEASQNGVDVGERILDLLQRDLQPPVRLSMDHLVEQLWELFSKDPVQYMEIISMVVISHMQGFEAYSLRLIDAIENFLGAHPGDLQSMRCLSFLYATFGEEKDIARMEELLKMVVELDPSPDSIELYLSITSHYDPNKEPDDGLWRYIDQLEKTHPEAYWYHSGVHYFHQDRFEEAFKAFELGASRFGGRSEVALGYCYMYGIGVTQDTEKAIQLLMPLRYQYPVANMYLAHERMFREIRPEALTEALAFNQLLSNGYLPEGMIDSCWLCVAFLNRYDGGEEFKEVVRKVVDEISGYDKGEVYALIGLLAMMRLLPEYDEKDQMTLFFKGHSRGSAAGTLALTLFTSCGGALQVEGFEKVARNKEVAPRLRAICFLNCFLNSLVLDQYDEERAERYLKEMARLEPAFLPAVEGLRLIGYHVGKVHEADTLLERNAAYRAKYPDYGLPAVVEALLKGGFEEALGAFGKDPRLENDLVSTHVLAVLSHRLTEDARSQKLFLQWMNRLAPLADFYYLAEAFSGRLFPKGLNNLE